MGGCLRWLTGYGPQVTHMPSTCAAATTRAPPKWCLLLRSAPFAALSMRAAGGLCQKVTRPEPCACAGGGFGRGKMALPCVRCNEGGAGAP